MGLLDGGGILNGGLSNLAQEMGQPESTAKDRGESYRVPLAPENFDEFGATLVDTDTEVELARIETTAGLERRFGYGRADVPSTLGRLYGVHKNADDETIHGSLTFKWENSTGRSGRVYDVHKTRDMNTTDRNDRENQIGFPEPGDKPRAEENEYLVVYFEPDTPAADITNDYAIDAGATEARYPITEYDVAKK